MAAPISYSPTSGMTLGDLVEGVMSAIYGLTAQTDSTAYLTAPMSTTDLTFTVDDPDDLSAGYVEIDTELIRISEVDKSTGVATIAPTGRGRKGTAAASHSVGAEVRITPIVPYFSIIREIRSELRSYYPLIASTWQTEFTATATSCTYELPADAGNVLDVQYKDRLGEWQRIRSWEVEHGVNTTDVTTGVALRVCVAESVTVRVIYGKPFSQLSALTDTLSSAGVPESLEDVIRYGAQCRLLPSLDIARLSVTSTASADANGRPPTPGTGVMVARELKAAYRDRLAQEITTFRSYFPIRLHKTR